MAAAVVLSAALINPVESAAQRQRSPGGNGGGGRQDSGGGQQRESGGGRQRESGGGGQQRANGGGRQQDNGGARQQDNGRTQARAAQPRSDSGGDRGDAGRREAPPVVRENAPPPPRPQARTEAAPIEAQPRAQRRFPTAADRSSGGNVIRNRADRGNVVQGGSVGGNVTRADGGAYARSGTGRVAVPRVGPPPQRHDDHYHYSRNVYGSHYGGHTVYGRYPYRGSRNIYIVPYGRTYGYYPGYYYNAYSFGYGPYGRGHFYFDLSYNSYIWHPYSVYRYGTYGSYGYPVGELRLKVEPRDAQVFIDGYYAGRVDDFDGTFQSLRLEDGEYQVEIVLPGYEPLAFDVRILPGEKTTYEGVLLPEQQR